MGWLGSVPGTLLVSTLLQFSFLQFFQTYEVQEFVYFGLYHPDSVGMVKVLKPVLASYHKVIDYRYVGLKIK